MDSRRTFLFTAGAFPLLANAAIREEMAPEASTSEAAGAPNSPAPSGILTKRRYSQSSFGMTARSNLFGDRIPVAMHQVKKALKNELRGLVLENDPMLNFLVAFDQTFDDLATASLLKAASHLYRPDAPDQLVYAPQLYDVWIASVSELLDRCLAYRREMSSFEIDGIKLGIEYLAFLKMSPISRELIDIASGSDVATIQENAQTQAAKKYRAAPSTSYSDQGKGVEATGNAEAAKLTAMKEEVARKARQSQYDVTVEAELAKYTSYTTLGSASNYGERYLRLATLLQEDLTNAYKKLVSISIGMGTVLNVTSFAGISSNATCNSATATICSAIPQFTGQKATKEAINNWVASIVGKTTAQQSPDVLDAMVIWARAAMREIERLGQDECEVTVSIPLNHKSGKLMEPLISHNDWQIARGREKNEPIYVTIKLVEDALPFNVKFAHLRLLAVGLTIVHHYDDVTPMEYLDSFSSAVGDGTKRRSLARERAQWRYARLNATLTPPQQPGRHRARILVSNVRIQGGAGGDLEPALSGQYACHNINPMGEWKIEIDRSDVVWYPEIDLATFKRSTDGKYEDFKEESDLVPNFALGLILHMRLRGVPMPIPGA